MISKFCKIIAIIWLAAIMVSCYDDKGNYDYVDSNSVMPVEIANLSNNGLSVIAKSLMEVTPQLENDNPGRYTYMWYAIADSYPYNKEILSTERDLSITCNLTVGKYTLYFLVLDEARDIYKSVSTPLTVTATDITSGWYVLKGIDGSTDIDYFPLEGEERSDLLRNVLKIEPLKGSPIGIAYAANCYAHEKENADGTVTLLTGQSVLHVASNEDLISLNANDMSVFKTLEEQFYEMPERINIQSIETDYVDPVYGTHQLLVNDGNLHVVGTDRGKFGYQQTGDFKVHPDILYGYFGSNFYDSKHYEWNYTNYSSSQKMISSNDTVVIDFATPKMELIHLLPRIEKSLQCKAYGFFHSLVKEKYYVVDISTFPLTPNFSPDPIFYELNTSNLLPKAKVMAAPISASVIYFALDNRLMMHKVTSGSETELTSFGADEKITFIKHFSITEKFSDLVVVTTSPTGYKIYRFPTVGSAGEIEVNKTPVMSGKGVASFVLYRNE